MDKLALLFRLEQMIGTVRVYCRVRPKMGPEIKFKTSFTYSEDNKIVKDGR